MTRVTRRLDISLRELDRWTNAHCAEPYDEPPRDLAGNPLTDEQALELVRDLEQRSGRQLIFRRGERDSAGRPDA